MLNFKTFGQRVLLLQRYRQAECSRVKVLLAIKFNALLCKQSQL